MPGGVASERAASFWNNSSSLLSSVPFIPTPLRKYSIIPSSVQPCHLARNLRCVDNVETALLREVMLSFRGLFRSPLEMDLRALKILPGATCSVPCRA